jgi:hypothetical protein
MNQDNDEFRRMAIIKGILRWLISDRKNALYARTLIENLADCFPFDESIQSFLLDTIETCMDAHNWLSMDDLMSHWRWCCNTAIESIHFGTTERWLSGYHESGGL